MQFIPAQKKADFATIENLAKTIWTEHYTPIIGKKQVDYMLDKFQSVEAISNQISDSGYHYYIIRDDNKNTGYIGIQPIDKELFLSKIYVKSSERGKGYGREAMQFIENFAKKKKLKKITLTVNKNNTNSINAYEKMGFSCVASIVQDIGNGFVMDDFKMEKFVS
jgi:diamine N-acetyltransferase